jgi:hypothetical protein
MVEVALILSAAWLIVLAFAVAFARVASRADRRSEVALRAQTPLRVVVGAPSPGRSARTRARRSPSAVRFGRV